MRWIKDPKLDYGLNANATPAITTPPRLTGGFLLLLRPWRRGGKRFADHPNGVGTPTRATGASCRRSILSPVALHLKQVAAILPDWNG